MENLRTAIVGSSGHALVLADILVARKNQECVGWIDPSRAPGEWINGLPVLGSDVDIRKIVHEYNIQGVVIGIGDNGRRRVVVQNLTNIFPELRYHTAVHPSAIVATSAVIEAGSVVMAGAVINPGASIGEHCIINTSSSIDHEVRIADFSSIGPGAVIGGGCEVGNQTAIGIGAIVKHKVKIGSKSLVGAGALQLHDVGENEVWFGAPSKKIRSRQDDDRYL